MFSGNHTMHRATAKCFVALLLMLFAPTVWGLSSEPQGNAQVEVRLISGVNGTGDLATLPLGLEVKLAEGWKTYWRNPGDAGAPPQLEWPVADNPNLAQVEFHYPVPQRHMIAGMETIGYHDHVIFPLTITPKKIGAALELTTKLTILTCAEQCIPNDFTLHLTLPAGEAKLSDEAASLNEATVRVPEKTNLNITSILQDKQGTVTLAFTAPTVLQRPEAFIETPEGNLFAPPEITMGADQQQGTLRFTAYDKTSRPNPLKLTITLVEADKGWEDTAELLPPAPIATIAPAASPTLWIMLWFAFLGGLILNLMPCVLPVLSLKVLKFMGHGGRENTDARRSFLFTSAGILCSFLVLAIALLGLRAAGQSIGWGIQFQHPAFLLFLMGVLLLFAANLWGWFEIRLPDWLTQKLAVSSARPKALGDFLTGAFAALLATPCTAPFLGTALGFALSSDLITATGVFLGMGLGMAAPYLLVAAFPALATKMPRPGAWMLRLKQLLAFALFATALWLGYVLWQQQNPAARDHRWQAFDQATIAQEVAAGKTVFVDVTAAWCLTCQTNKKLVLYQAPVAARLFDGDIITMQADWTRPDPAIAAYLQSFQRAGIPFNVVYSPLAPQGIILPELLTTQAVLEGLDKAAGKP